MLYCKVILQDLTKFCVNLADIGINMTHNTSTTNHSTQPTLHNTKVTTLTRANTPHTTLIRTALVSMST